MHFESLRRCEVLDQDWSRHRCRKDGMASVPGDSDLTFRTATGELVEGGKRMHVEGCDDWGSNLRVRGVQAPVCKPLLFVGESLCCMVTNVTCFTKVRMLRRKLMLGSRREWRDSQHRGCTVVCKQRVQQIHETKRKQDRRLSGESESGEMPGIGTAPGPCPDTSEVGETDKVMAFLDDIVISTPEPDRVTAARTMAEELWTHARIQVHFGKTQVWNRGGIEPCRDGGPHQGLERRSTPHPNKD